MLGVRFILAAPDGYGFDDAFLQRTTAAALPKAELLVNGSPDHAVDEADVIYTDVWTSMGQEAEREQRLQQFAGFQVNAALLAQAPAHARRDALPAGAPRRGGHAPT